VARHVASQPVTSHHVTPACRRASHVTPPLIGCDDVTTQVRRRPAGVPHPWPTSRELIRGNHRSGSQPEFFSWLVPRIQSNTIKNSKSGWRAIISVIENPFLPIFAKSGE
jgi:hypothetical protein